MNRHIHWSLSPVILACLLLAGCESSPSRPTNSFCSQSGVIFLNRTEVLLCYFNEIQEQSVSERDLELHHRERILDYSKDPSDLLRVVMLMALNAEDLEAVEKAQALIDPMPGTLTGNETLHNVAALLRAWLEDKHAALTEHMALMAQLEKETRRADANKNRSGELRQELSEQAQQMTEQQEHTQELEEQLEALKNIESTIGARKRADRMETPEN